MLEMLFISENICQKLKNKKPAVKAEFVEAAWINYHGITLFDTREEHRSYPPTEWFVVKHEGRTLKIVFVTDDDGICYLKSAFDADKNDIRIFKRKGGSL